MNRSGTIKTLKKYLKNTITQTIRWELEDGTLTLMGEGSMPDFTDASPPPWSEWCGEIIELNVWNLKSVGARAFRNCRNLTAVYLDNSIERIGFAAFEDCTGLQSLSTPRKELLHQEAKKLTQRQDALYFSRRAFLRTPWGRERLGDFSVFRGILLEYTGESESVRIPEGIREIGRYAFENCPVKAVVLPESMRMIRSFAFAGTQIKELVIPAGVREIETFAFAFTDSLRSVTIENNKILLAENAFYKTKLRNYYSEGNRKWGSIYSVSGVKERGIDAGKRLRIQRKKGPHMGIREHDPGKDLFRRIRRGNLIIRIWIDDENKRIRFIQSFRWNRNYNCPETYLLYPCGEPGEVAEPWRDSFTYVDDTDILCCCTEGLADGDGTYRWYVSSFESSDMGCGAELELLWQWMEMHPDFRVDTIDENLENDSLRMFVPC